MITNQRFMFVHFTPTFYRCSKCSFVYFNQNVKFFNDTIENANLNIEYRKWHLDERCDKQVSCKIFDIELYKKKTSKFIPE